MYRRVKVLDAKDENGNYVLSCDGDLEFKELKRYAVGGWVDKEQIFSSNLSTEYTILIQNAGRWCERFASDILIDIKTIEEWLENVYDECKDFDDEILEKSFLFGFRQDGVDHNAFISYNVEENAYMSPRIKPNYYRAIYELCFKVYKSDKSHLQIDYGFARVD